MAGAMARRKRVGRRVSPTVHWSVNERMDGPDAAAGGGLHDARAVHRAIGELRRGAPVLFDGPAPILVLAAETVSADGLAEAVAVAGAPAPVLLLTSAARAAVLRDGALGTADDGLVASVVACGLDALTDRPGRLDSLLPGEPSTPPDDADAALAVCKLARLMPAALVTTVSAGAAERATAHGTLSVDPALIRAHPARAAMSLAIVAEAPVPLADAVDARMVAFRGPDAGIEHLAIVVGNPQGRDAPLVRLHSECFTGDLLGSLRCDCGDQLRGAIRRMTEDGAGVLLYLAQEGRGIGLVNKLRAYSLQDGGLDTLDANRALGWDADERSFGIAATMLRRLGLGRVRLLTNNPQKIAALEAWGIAVAGRVAIPAPANDVNAAYLRTKRLRFGHLPS